jgi:hypothetical protein
MGYLLYLGLSKRHILRDVMVTEDALVLEYAIWSLGLEHAG